MLKIKFSCNAGRVILNHIARLKETLLELILKLWKIFWHFCPCAKWKSCVGGMISSANSCDVSTDIKKVKLKVTFKKKKKTYPWVHYLQCLELSACVHCNPSTPPSSPVIQKSFHAVAIELHGILDFTVVPQGLEPCWICCLSLGVLQAGFNSC